MIGVIGIGRRVLPVTEVHVVAGSSAAGRTVGEIERGCECRVLAIGGRFAPGSDELVEPGGLTVVASLLGLRRLNRETAAH